jgi:hypothetical protein
VSWLSSNYLEPAGVDCSNPALAAKLKALAEFAKVKLSESDQVTLRWEVPKGLAVQLVVLRGAEGLRGSDLCWQLWQ